MKPSAVQSRTVLHPCFAQGCWRKELSSPQWLSWRWDGNLFAEPSGISTAFNGVFHLPSALVSTLTERSGAIHSCQAARTLGGSTSCAWCVFWSGTSSSRTGACSMGSMDCASGATAECTTAASLPRRFSGHGVYLRRSGVEAAERMGRCEGYGGTWCAERGRIDMQPAGNVNTCRAVYIAQLRWAACFKSSSKNGQEPHEMTTTC